MNRTTHKTDRRKVQRAARQALTCAIRKACLLLVISLSLVLSAAGQAKPVSDVEKEVRSYLDRTSPEKKAQSDAYFEGGYWLQLWTFVWGAGIAAVLIQGRLSARMRDLAERLTRFKLQTGAYAQHAFCRKDLNAIYWKCLTSKIRRSTLRLRD